MYSQYKRRLYTPQFSEVASISVRRLAWATNKKMTKTIDLIVKLLPTIVNPSKVCSSCQAKECQACIFCKPVNPDELTALEAVI
jgi:recombinational DNA repair protein RecR